MFSFCIPKRARQIVAEQGSSTKVVLLGTRGFGEYMLRIPRADRNFDVAGVVDDFLAAKVSAHWGAPLLTSEDFRALAREHGDLLAINTCKRSKPKKYFAQLCQECGVASVSFEQAVKVFDLFAAVRP